MSTRAAHLQRRPRVQRARMKPRRMVQAQPGPQTSGTAQAGEEHEQLPYVLLPQEAWRRGPYGRGSVPYSPRQALSARSVGARHVSIWLGQILPPVGASGQPDFRSPVSTRNAILCASGHDQCSGLTALARRGLLTGLSGGGSDRGTSMSSGIVEHEPSVDDDRSGTKDANSVRGQSSVHHSAQNELGLRGPLIRLAVSIYRR